MLKRQNSTLSIEDFEDAPLPDCLITNVDYDEKLTLTSGLDCLSHDDALIIVLKVIVGLSHLEISKLLKIPYRTVRYRYQKAISRLKVFLSEPHKRQFERSVNNENDEKSKTL